MSTVLTCSRLLPAGFRQEGMLAFHRRDAQQTAERVTAESLQKAMIWGGVPACLALHFHAGRVDARLMLDGEVDEGQQHAFDVMVGRMLGLAQNVEAFEDCYRAHPQLGALIAVQSGLRVPAAATPFEALVWAVTGQQISVGAAISMRRKLILAANVVHSSGLFCHPDAEQIVHLGEKTLREAGFSAAKAHTLLALSALVLERQLPLDEWLGSLPVAQVNERLLAVRGIGPWTVNYTLLRGFGYLDGSLHGDVVVRNSLQALLRTPQKLSEGQARAWLAAFSPWRALVAAHLWAMKPAVRAG